MLDEIELAAVAQAGTFYVGAPAVVPSGPLKGNLIAEVHAANINSS